MTKEVTVTVAVEIRDMDGSGASAGVSTKFHEEVIEKDTLNEAMRFLRRQAEEKFEKSRKAWRVR